MTYALDRGVGTVIRGLKDSGKFDNTLILLSKNSMDKYNKKIVMSKLLVVQK